MAAAGGRCSLDPAHVYEATKVVFARVHELDPDNASKIMGMLLIRDDGDAEMVRLAFGPEHLLHSFVARSRAELDAKSPSPPSPVRGGGGGGGPLWGPPSPGRELFAGDQAGYDGGGEALYPEDDGCWSPAASGAPHRRGFSLGGDAEAPWRPCLYYARGFCKNGASCRFLHGGPPEDDAPAAAEREMAVMRAKAFAAAVTAAAAANARPPQLAPPPFPFPPSPPKGLGFLLQQQQRQHGDAQRCHLLPPKIAFFRVVLISGGGFRTAAAAAMLFGGDDDAHRFTVRSPRMDRGGDLTSNPSARQIYLTFPADSSFTEDDVANYFSMYGPVQDVRIPFQAKRMFGFVTFVFPETVRLILAKGNPHFICDARVLVKPYKEKGKVPDKHRKQQHPHHGELAGLLDAGDPFDVPPPIGPRMMYGGSIASHEAFLRRKLEQQQHAAELQQAAIELQGRRFMGLQLMDLKSRGHHLGSPVGSHMPLGLADLSDSGNGNAVHLDDITFQDSMLNSGLATSAPASSALFGTDAEGKREDQQEEHGDATPKQAVNPGEGEKRESSPGAPAPNVACGFQESGVEHNLPDSPFATPTKASIDIDTAATAQDGNINDISPHHVASSLFPPSSSLELPPYNSCFFQVPSGSPLGMKPLGCEYRAKRGPLSSNLGGLMTPSNGGRVESFNKY
ncbi:hypothetical protein ACP4OV_014870 [Aristida adscensionis]